MPTGTQRIAVSTAALALILACVAFAEVQSPAPATPATQPAQIDGITLPSEKRKLSFANPGIIAKALVKEGDQVKEGQELMTQDDVIERRQMEALKLEAFSPLSIKYAKADRDAKKTILERTEVAWKANKAATDFELEEAKLNLALAEIKVDLAEQEQKQKQLEYAKQEHKVWQMTLRSTCNGFVQKLELSAGEAVDPSRPAVTVIQADPLWVEFHVTPAQGMKFRNGQKLKVKYEDGVDAGSGTVIFKDPLVDSGATSRLIRLELTNPSKREPGWKVWIELPDTPAEGVKTADGR